MGASESSFFLLFFVLLHMRLGCVWALGQQTGRLLLKAQRLPDHFSQPVHHHQLTPTYYTSRKSHLAIKATYACLTWDTCGCLDELSIEVRNDCIAFLRWLHPAITRDTKSISVFCSRNRHPETGSQVLSEARFLSGRLVNYLRAYTTNVNMRHGFSIAAF